MVRVTKVNRNIKSLASDHAETVIKTLVGILTSSKAQDSARVSAGKELLDRGFGKAVSAVELSGKDGGPMEVSEMSEAEKLRRFPHAFAMLQEGLKESADSDEKDDSVDD